MPRSESSPVKDRDNTVAIIERLHLAGWSIGEVPLRGRGWLAGLDRSGTARGGPSDSQRPDAH